MEAPPTTTSHTGLPGVIALRPFNAKDAHYAAALHLALGECRFEPRKFVSQRFRASRHCQRGLHCYPCCGTVLLHRLSAER